MDQKVFAINNLQSVTDFNTIDATNIKVEKFSDESINPLQCLGESIAIIDNKPVSLIPLYKDGKLMMVALEREQCISDINTVGNVYTNVLESGHVNLQAATDSHHLKVQPTVNISNQLQLCNINKPNTLNRRTLQHCRPNPRDRSRLLNSMAKIDIPSKVPSEVFKKWIEDPSDIICRPPELPKTKFEVKLKESPLDVIMRRPLSGVCDKLKSKFSRNCLTSNEPDSIDVQDLGLLPFGYEIPFDKSKVKRITRKRKNKYIASQGNYINQIIIEDNIEYLLPEESYNEIMNNSREVVIDQDGNKCFILSGELETTEGDCEQILVIKDESDICQARNNIEVLLAAAEEGETSTNQLFICPENNNQDNIDIKPLILEWPISKVDS